MDELPKYEDIIKKSNISSYINNLLNQGNIDERKIIEVIKRRETDKERYDDLIEHIHMKFYERDETYEEEYGDDYKIFEVDESDVENVISSIEEYMRTSLYEDNNNELTNIKDKSQKLLSLYKEQEIIADKIEKLKQEVRNKVKREE